MIAKGQTNRPSADRRWYRGAKIPMSVIRRFARRVAEQFQPNQIILFGSHAYGRPHADSDVDILVVMAARNVTDQAIRIRQAVQAPFPMDLIVRTPQYVAWGLQEGDWFLREIVSQGKVLYEKGDKAVGAKSRRRLSNSAKAARGKNPAPLPNLLPLSAHAGRPSSDPLFCRQPVDGPPLC
ncbi:MAG TPA: nucleotidyltransferase domain-containing protein [Gemmataceae bacterium]|jgi:predicted nucleotidyltransferase|nr:nucleotidyltransferase domain-containing protein [Gemmataceae bacterium]